MATSGLTRWTRPCELASSCAALAIHEQLLPLCRALFCTTNPIPVKAALELSGWPVGAPRLPLLPANDDVKQRLSETLAALRPT